MVERRAAPYEVGQLRKDHAGADEEGQHPWRHEEPHRHEHGLGWDGKDSAKLEPDFAREGVTADADQDSSLSMRTLTPC